MCGIAGVLFADKDRPISPDLLRTMGDSLRHRGPDAEGIWSERGIGLVHRRLSIIDLSGGDQPIGNEDGSIQVIFNGEIYNFKELRAGLQAKGHQFQTASDTEVIVHLYEEEGERLVERLRGMFTFALWDRKRRRLLLARDRVGIKPLYLYRDDQKLIFGSELKAILAYPGIARNLDTPALESYLTFGMVTGSSSIFKGIVKLPPAHTLLVGPEDWSKAPRRYWQLNFDADHGRSTAEWEEAIRAKIDETVRLHLIADVPVGAFLSGGMDSSVMVASAAGLTDGPLQTFSIGFREESFSELPYARRIAEDFKTTHTEEVVTPDAADLIDELTYHFDEPFADSSAIPTFLVSRLAARSVKVVLSGDGGDEAFGGYARYAHDLKEAALRRWLPRWLRRFALGPLGRIWPKTDWLPKRLRAKTLLTNVALEPADAYANTLSICRRPLRRLLLNRDLAATLNGHTPETVLCEGHRHAPRYDALAGMLSADTAVTLPDDFLVKVDRASMAHGLEVRPPLLDHELLELAARIPSDLKVRRGETKWIFKQAYRNRLPGGVVYRPKHGFDMPIDTWLRGPLREMFDSAVLDPAAPVKDLIHQPAARDLYHAHQTGRSRQGAVLWSLLILARWADRYLRPSMMPAIAY